MIQHNIYFPDAGGSADQMSVKSPPTSPKASLQKKSQTIARDSGLMAKASGAIKKGIESK